MKKNQGPPRGVRDFYPADLRKKAWLMSQFRNTALAFGFEEIEAPIADSAALFERAPGEEIAGQTYGITSPSGREPLALRPEFTPQLARMIEAKKGSLQLPIRWFSLPQCWRYERPGKGRRREHYQWNMDLWGEPGVTAEAELIAAAFALLDSLGLPEDCVEMRISHRKLLEETLQNRFPGAPFRPLCTLIDKSAKIGPDAFEEALQAEVGLNAKAARELIQLLGTPDLEAFPGSGAEDLKRLFALLDAYGLQDRVRFDPAIVRGLAYYTGAVFEATDRKGRFRALCGGGRYDGFRNSRLPAAGFGFGDAVLEELLMAEGKLPDFPKPKSRLIYPMTPACRPAAARLAKALREQGKPATMQLAMPPPGKVFSAANRAGVSEVFTIGPEELAENCCSVKNMETGESWTEPLPGTP